jgi:hypothetical protein
VPYLDASLTRIYEMPVRVSQLPLSPSVVEAEEAAVEGAVEEVEMTFRCT